MMFDRFRFFSKGREIFSISVEGNDEVLSNMQKGEGFIIAGSHVGSMEMAGYMLGLKDKPINAVVFGGEAASLQAKRAQSLSEGGIKMIPVSTDMSHLFTIKAALDEGEIVSMPCDRLFGSTKYFEKEFLGAPARFPVGAFMLSAQLGKTMVALFNVKDGDTYKVFVRPIETSREGKTSRQIASELAGVYAKELEDIVRKYPLQWFNFYEFWDFDD